MSETKSSSSKAPKKTEAEEQEELFKFYKEQQQQKKLKSIIDSKGYEEKKVTSGSQPKTAKEINAIVNEYVGDGTEQFAEQTTTEEQECLLSIYSGKAAAN